MAKTIILFDLDGTLVDSSPGILASLSAAFRESDISPSEPLTPALIGPPLRETLSFLCSNPEDKTLDQLTASFKAHYDTSGFQQTIPFPGVGDMLQTLNNANIPLHIATNKRQRPTAQILDKLGWSGLFDQVISPDSFSPPLHNKAVILTRLLAEANLEAIDCLYVGDRLDDYKAAKECGILFALAEWGFEGNFSAFTPDTIRLKNPNAEHLMTLVFDRENR
jgi:phosphoglycolate phosphatase